MLHCPRCGARTKYSYNFCFRCGYKLKHSVDDFKPKEEEFKEFKINEYLTLKLEKGKTIIYINEEKFLQCKYLLIEIPVNRVRNFDNIQSIDEVIEKLDHSLEDETLNRKISVETEFWGHCSNLQAWADNDYDTRLLHSNLAFPLLKRLTDIGDPKAKKVFKEEIAERMTSGHSTVMQYLIQQNYLEYFNEEEIETIMACFMEEATKYYSKKYKYDIDYSELSALVDIICDNFKYSKKLITTRIRPIDKLNKLGFTIEGNHIFGIAFENCGLKILPETLGTLKFLRELYLSKNQIKQLPKSIGYLSSLQKLFLNDNHIIELPAEVGNMESLIEFKLDHNIIKSLPETIGNLRKLETLSLWGNQLREMPENLSNLKSLKILNLSFNHLDSLPEDLFGLESLEVLDLSNNSLKDPPNSIGSLKSLNTLWLNNNPLQSIPDSLTNLTSLRSLYLINTPIAINPNIQVKEILDALEKKDVNVWK